MFMSYNIAVVEDDAHQRGYYAEALRGNGYVVTEYGDRRQAIEGFDQQLPDMAILDIMLGSEVGGGFEVCRELKRRSPHIPVIFLTSRGDELDKIYGLQLGAWDYQTKPVSLDFLITRVDSLFRIKQDSRSQMAETRLLGKLTLSPANMSATWNNTPVGLTPTEFEILAVLIDHPGGASIEELVKATRQGVVEDNTINTHILHIRKKLKQLDPTFDCIKTRYGFGYCWTCQ